MPLKTRKPLFFLAVFSVLILAAVAVTYKSSTTLVEQTIAADQQGVADEAAKMTEIWLDQQTRIVEATSRALAGVKIGENPETLQLLQMAMHAGHFSDVYIGTPNGRLIDGAAWTPPEGYDPRQRPWYKRALEAGKTAFTTPYIDLVTNKLVIALVAPLTAGDAHLGVLGADTVLDTLIEKLRSIRIGETGYAFIVADDGTILVHPDESYVHRLRLQQLDPSLASVLDHFAAAPAGALTYRRNGAEQVLAYHRINGSSWVLCTTIPRAEAYAIARRTTVLLAAEMILRALATLALVTLAFVVASIIVLFLFSRQMRFTLQKQQEEISGIHQDLAWNISKRKELEKHYQTLFNVANDAILVSKDLTIIECNEKASEVFGRTRLNLIGRSLLDLSPPQQNGGISSRSRAEAIIGAVHAGEHQIFEWTFLRIDNAEFPAEVSITGLQLDNERLCLSSIRDISARVNAEQQLRQAQKMAAMGEMLGAIAHQWRQPLNILSTYIASLKSAQLNDRLNRAFVDRLVTGSDAQIQFMSKTIDDFRNFFRPSRSRENFDIAAAVNTAVMLIEPSLRHLRTDLYVQLDTEEKSLTVSGYPSEFVHVIVNILANARDAIRERQKQEKPIPRGRIEITLESTETTLGVRICDNGVGIPAGQHDKIFTPYYTTKGTAAGTGLGLYMAKMIVEKEMHGEIVATSPGQGACLIIRIPKEPVTGEAC